MERLLNNIFVRIIVGITIGLPITPLALMYGIHGLVIGFQGLVEGNYLSLLIGALSVAVLIGIIGAWWRLFRSSDKMKMKERKAVRIMLFCGMISCLGLAAWALFLELTPKILLLFVLPALAGAVFVSSTPLRSTSALQPTPKSGAAEI